VKEKENIEEIKIEKCAICGGHANIFNWHDRYLALCPRCGRHYAIAFCKGEFPDDGEKTKKEAIEVWNSKQQALSEIYKDRVPADEWSWPK
jgi:hypothetical protein